jgi:hypothetical protein
MSSSLITPLLSNLLSSLLVSLLSSLLYCSNLCRSLCSHLCYHCYCEHRYSLIYPFCGLNRYMCLSITFAANFITTLAPLLFYRQVKISKGGSGKKVKAPKKQLTKSQLKKQAKIKAEKEVCCLYYRSYLFYITLAAAPLSNKNTVILKPLSCTFINNI